MERLRFHFYGTTKLADDSSNADSFDDRASAAEKSARSMAEKRAEPILVATYDPDSGTTDPVYMVSPWRPKK